MTIELFYEDPYRKDCNATVTAINESGIQLDQTIFYPTGGGQPGDTGTLVCADGSIINIIDTVKSGSFILHLPDNTETSLKVGDHVTVSLNWERRNRHMRFHTCLHLLCSLIPHPVTGGAVSAEKGRLDFDMPDQTVNKEQVTAELNRLIEENHPVEIQWITDEELQKNMDLVRTMSVKPPMGQGKVRLVNIKNVDLQPCGGTHLTATGEIGKVRLGKVEKKGKQNRRVNILFDE